VRPPIRLLTRLLIGFLLVQAAAWAAPASAGVFSGWAAVVVAGDWRAHSGAPSEVFDNARRDLVKAFIAKGFSPDHISQFSIRPERYPNDGALHTDSLPIVHRMRELARTATDGCLVYFTSHGSPEGVIVGERMWTPNIMASVLDDTCGQRPTVVIISACFSGVFVPLLASPNRMVLTAARADRASFGCGEADRYTYFDGCILKEIGAARDFAALGRRAQACVAKLEADTHATPPSEPQLEIGAALSPMLPLYAFAAPP
jgi:hypothetical protein